MANYEEVYTHTNDIMRPGRRRGTEVIERTEGQKDENHESGESPERAPSAS